MGHNTKKTLQQLDLAAGKVKQRLQKLQSGGKQFVANVKEDIAAFRARDPAAKSDAEILLLYSGLHARIAHRVSHKLHQSGHTFCARAVSQGARLLTGIEIHPGAKIGKGLVIDHGAGVVIGETAEIGDNCTIYQGVTLGGTGKDVGKRHPTLGDNVMIGAGAKVLGPLTIGNNAKIAAGAVVLDDIPSESTAVGIPAHVVRVKGERIANDLDQIHIPDPVDEEVRDLRSRTEALQQSLAELQAEFALQQAAKAAAAAKRAALRKKKEQEEQTKGDTI